MAMPLGHFREDIVVPCMNDFRKEQDALHKGFSAVSAVDAYAAHIFSQLVSMQRDPFAELGDGPSNNRDDTHFRGLLAKLSDSFELVRDVAKANKHAFLVRGNVAKLKANGSNDTVRVQLAYGEGGFGDGQFGGASYLVVKCQDGTQRKLLSELEKALKFLDAVCNRLGLRVNSIYFERYVIAEGQNGRCDLGRRNYCGSYWWGVRALRDVSWCGSQQARHSFNGT